MAKMTEEALRALTDAEMRQSIGYGTGKLAEQRMKAEYYYLGIAKGDLAPPEIDGRSSVVSPDVRNTIESMLPQLMLKFCGGDSVVDFEATQPEDEKAAKAATDYLNYLFFKKNNGHAITYTWIKDALLQKRGIIKVWWDTRDEETREEYKGLDEFGLATLMDDDEIEVTEQKSYSDEEDQEQREQAIQQITQQLQQAVQAAQQGNPQAMQAAQQMQQHLAQIQAQPPKMLYDITAKRTKSGGKVTVENVPPEEFLISRKAKTIADAPFCGHRVQRTRSELKSMGYKNVDNITSDDSAAAFSLERAERLAYDDEYAYAGNVQTDASDKSQELIWVTECYIRCDYDDDGIAELRKVTRAGNEILDNEVVDAVPFVSICPVPMPHKFFGLSVADLALESQKTRTSILRSQLDNMYLQVNGRYFAVDGQVNLEDLLTSRPGGIVRIKQQGAAGRLDQGAGDMNAAGGMMEYMHQFLEDSTGWSRNSQANDPGGLQGTATAANIVTNKADMRLDLIARNFAEGFVDLFRLMLKLVSQHQDKETQIKLSGEWVPMDPREWRNQFDVSINVGLGVGNKDQQVGHLMALAQQQAAVFPLGVATPENVYQSHSELAKTMGFKNADRFFTDPSKQPPQPPKPDPEQIKAQTEQAKMQASAQIENNKLQSAAQIAQLKQQQDAQLEQMRMQMQAEVDNNRQRAEAEQHTLKLQHEAQLAALKAQMDEAAHMRDMEFQRWKAELDASVRIQVANISAAVKTQNAATTASEQEISRDIQP